MISALAVCLVVASVPATRAAGRSPVHLRAPAAAPATAAARAPAAGADVKVADSFGRNLAGTLGVADRGGSWRLAGAPSAFSVSAGEGRLLLARPGSGLSASLDDVRVRDAVTTATFGVGRQSGGGTYVSLSTRRTSTADYRLRLRFVAGGTVTATLVRSVGGRETALAATRVDGLVPAAPRVGVRLTAVGSTATVLRAKVWRVGAHEPATWQLSALDATPVLRGAGGTGVSAYRSAASPGPSAPVTVDDLAVRQVAAAPPAPRTIPRPGPATTGVPPGTRLRVHRGDLVATTPGATYDSLDVHGFVRIRAPNVTIRRSLIRGGVATGNLGLVTNTSPNGRNFLIEDSTLRPAHPSVWLDGIKGGNYTARRLDVSGTVDTAKVHGDNVRIEASWLHDTRYYASDPNQHGGPTHNDGVQVLGGHHIRIVGNTVTGASNAAVQVTQDFRAVTDLTVMGNWFDGGSCTVNTNNKPLPTLRTVVLRANRFGRHMRYRDCAVLTKRAVALNASGNVYDDDGAPIRIHMD